MQSKCSRHLRLGTHQGGLHVPIYPTHCHIVLRNRHAFHAQYAHRCAARTTSTTRTTSGRPTARAAPVPCASAHCQPRPSLWSSNAYHGNKPTERGRIIRKGNDRILGRERHADQEHLRRGCHSADVKG